jgi:hypothetical protein
MPGTHKKKGLKSRKTPKNIIFGIPLFLGKIFFIFDFCKEFVYSFSNIAVEFQTQTNRSKNHMSL